MHDLGILTLHRSKGVGHLNSSHADFDVKL